VVLTASWRSNRNCRPYAGQVRRASLQHKRALSDICGRV
jgi:hypothetical protein